MCFALDVSFRCGNGRDNFQRTGFNMMVYDGDLAAVPWHGLRLSLCRDEHIVVDVEAMSTTLACQSDLAGVSVAGVGGMETLHGGRVRQ